MDTAPHPTKGVVTYVHPPVDYAPDEPMRMPAEPRFIFAAGQHWVGAACIGSLAIWALFIYGLMFLGHYLGWLS